MKKAIISILVIFAVIFGAAFVTVRVANDKLYALIYKPQQIVLETDKNKEIKLIKNDYFVCGKYTGEDLLWKCVNDTTVQCENIIEFRKYDDDNSDWESSDLKEWLNSEDGFLGKSDLKKYDIVKNDIFVLSKSEIGKIKQSERTKSPTLSAIKMSNSKYLFLRKNCWYWTSSSISTNSNSVSTITQNGGFYKTLSTDRMTGVCPAFNLKRIDVKILGGDGSRAKPYVIG